VVRYEWPHLELEIDCGSGTYIRSIARDVGETLGCGGLVEVLIRTKIGPFTLEDAVDLAALSSESLRASLRPAIEAVAGRPRVVLDAAQVAPIAAGRRVSVGPEILAGAAPGPIALVDDDGQLVALAEFNAESGWVQPRKVLIKQ
jgi:tRNA pseudouridine55 synthase